jgi:hypothetical protein
MRMCHKSNDRRYTYRLFRLIGEEKTLSIKLGKDAGQSTEDIILVRGPRADVEKAVKEINAIVEDAKNDVILSSYVSKYNLLGWLSYTNVFHLVHQVRH